MCTITFKQLSLVVSSRLQTWCISTSGLVVKSQLAMLGPRVRFPASAIFLPSREELYSSTTEQTAESFFFAGERRRKDEATYCKVPYLTTKTKQIKSTNADFLSHSLFIIYNHKLCHLASSSYILLPECMPVNVIYLYLYLYLYLLHYDHHLLQFG